MTKDKYYAPNPIDFTVDFVELRQKFFNHLHSAAYNKIPEDITIVRTVGNIMGLEDNVIDRILADKTVVDALRSEEFAEDLELLTFYIKMMNAAKEAYNGYNETERNIYKSYSDKVLELEKKIWDDYPFDEHLAYRFTGI